MILVILESPFGKRLDGTTCSAAEIRANIRYARLAMADSFARGEAPFASHLIYPQILNDATPDERRAGIEAGLAWAVHATRAVVYADHGITPGMSVGINRHRERGIEVVARSIL